MRVYVDAAIHRWHGKLWCHLFSPNLDDLHVFASHIGMKREWFQDPLSMPKISWGHYDIHAGRRELAIRLGAIPLGRHQTIVMSRIIIGRHGSPNSKRDPDPLSFHRQMNSPMVERLEHWLNRELAILNGNPSVEAA